MLPERKGEKKRKENRQTKIRTTTPVSLKMCENQQSTENVLITTEMNVRNLDNAKLSL